MTKDHPKGASVIVDLLHVDDEMWSIRQSAAGLRKLIHQAVGADRVTSDSLQLENDPNAMIVHEPVRVGPSFDVAGLPVFLRLTQIGSFARAADLLAKNYFHGIIIDAHDKRQANRLGSSNPDMQIFRNYAGYHLLRGVTWSSTQRMIYSIHYRELHDSQEVDLIAAELKAFVTDHPLYDGTRQRFIDRVERMFKAAIDRAVIGSGRYWMRCCDGRSGQRDVRIELLERTDDEGWRPLVNACPLSFWARNAGHTPGPSTAQYVMFIWMLGYSRACLAGLDPPLPDRTRGRSSWVRALTEMYRGQKLLNDGGSYGHQHPRPKVKSSQATTDIYVGGFHEHRNRDLYPTTDRFDVATGGPEGFWPGVPAFVLNSGKVGPTLPLLDLNILDYLVPIKAEWLPEYETSRKERYPVLTRNIVDPILPFLPRPRDRELFPLDEMPQKLQRID